MKKILLLLALLPLKVSASNFLIQSSNTNPNDSVAYSSISITGLLYTGGGVQFPDGSQQTSAKTLAPVISFSSATALSLTLTPQTTTFLATLNFTAAAATGTIVNVQEDNAVTGVPYPNSLMNQCTAMGNGAFYYTSVSTNIPTAVVGATCTK